MNVAGLNGTSKFNPYMEQDDNQEFNSLGDQIDDFDHDDFNYLLFDSQKEDSIKLDRSNSNISNHISRKNFDSTSILNKSNSQYSKSLSLIQDVCSGPVPRDTEAYKNLKLLEIELNKLLQNMSCFSEEEQQLFSDSGIFKRKELNLCLYNATSKLRELYVNRYNFVTGIMNQLNSNQLDKLKQNQGMIENCLQNLLQLSKAGSSAKPTLVSSHTSASSITTTSLPTSLCEANAEINSKIRPLNEIKDINKSITENPGIGLNKTESNRPSQDPILDLLTN